MFVQNILGGENDMRMELNNGKYLSIQSLNQVLSSEMCNWLTLLTISCSTRRTRIKNGLQYDTHSV